MRPAAGVHFPTLSSPSSFLAAFRENPDLQGLTATAYFDPGESEPPYSATIRFTGRWVAGPPEPVRAHSFVKDEFIERVLPGSGPVSVTTRVYGIDEGEWNVQAEIVGRHELSPDQEKRLSKRSPRPPMMHPALWSWRRWSVSDSKRASVWSKFAVWARFQPPPAVVPGSWLGLVFVGIVVGFLLQWSILNKSHVSSGGIALASVLAVVAGGVGAKLWYKAQPSTAKEASGGSGWCIQGGVVGGGAAMVAALMAEHAPIGLVVGATTPALLAGMAIGRVGCFFTGCCGGRITTSRWGIWSSDQRVGARRIPTQLMEAALAGTVAVTTYVIARDIPAAVCVALLMVALSANTLLRQFVLRLRNQSHASAARLLVTVVGACAAIAVATSCWVFDAAGVTALCHPLVTA